jgi:hypothetical protein
MREKYWKAYEKRFLRGLQSKLYEQNEDPFIQQLNKGIKKINTFLEIVINGDESKPLEHHQFKILMEHTPIILTQAFGERFYKNHKRRLLGMCCSKHDHTIILSVVRRQTGKTELMVRMGVALIVAFPNMNNPNEPNEWLMSSFKEKHSRVNLRRAHYFIMKHLDKIEGLFKIEKTLNELRLIGKKSKKVERYLLVYPGDLDGLGGKQYLLDEFFKFLFHAIFQQLVPQMQIGKMLGIIMSSLKGERAKMITSYFLNPKKNELTRIVNVTEICEDCLKLPPEEAELCPHMDKIQAHFVDQDRREKSMKIMPMSLRMSEMRSVPMPTPGQIWTEHYLTKNFIENIWPVGRFSGYVHFMFIDPSMTSTGGSFTATTILSRPTRKDFVIKYLHKQLTPSNTQIVQYVEKDLEFFFSKFEDTFICLFVEMNVVNHGLEIHKMLLEHKYFDNRVHFYKGIDYRKRTREFDRYGVCKVGGDSEKFVQILSNQFEEKRMFFHPRCCTRSKHGINYMKEGLLEQCLNVKEVNYTDKSGGQVSKMVSKKGPGGSSCHDDQYISLASADMWSIKSVDPDEVKFYSDLLYKKAFRF